MPAPTLQRIQEMLHTFHTYGPISKEHLKTVVLTGGPCGGKTKFLEKATEVFEKQHNHKVVSVPEVARELMKAGFPPSHTWLRSTAFQERTTLAILEKEFFYLETLRLLKLPMDQKVIFFCDRGLMDSAAYIGVDAFNEVLSDFKIDPTVATERYDMVVHLVTAAIGAEAYYTADKERLESLEEAREIDPKTVEAWKRHPHHVVIDNSTSFDKKIERAIREVEKRFNLVTA